MKYLDFATLKGPILLEKAPLALFFLASHRETKKKSLEKTRIISPPFHRERGGI